MLSFFFLNLFFVYYHLIFHLSLALETFYCNYFQIEHIDQLVALTLSLKTAALNLPPN